MQALIEFPQVYRSSNDAVVLRSFDGQYPVSIVISTPALNSCVGREKSTPKDRWEIAQSNLARLARIAEQRYRQGDWTQPGDNHLVAERQLVLSETDLSAVRFDLPFSLTKV